MDNTSIILLLGFVATLIGVMTPIIKLNNLITELRTTLDILRKQLEETAETLTQRVAEHGRQLDAHSNKLVELETTLKHK